MRGYTRLFPIVAGLTVFSFFNSVAQVKPNTDDYPATTTQTVNTVPSAYSGSLPVNYVKAWTAQRPTATAGEIISGSRTLQEVGQVIQYVDGLGRPLQTVSKGASPNGYDVVTPMIYDEFGRVSLSYIPYVSSGTNGSFRTDPFNEQSSFMQGVYNPTANANGEKFFYNKTVYERIQVTHRETVGLAEPRELVFNIK
jgi:Domain of unknown function (DUF6443)